MSYLDDHGLDSEMKPVTDNVLDFILTGDKAHLSFPLRGLEVFAVIAGLREGDHIIHDTENPLTDDQVARYGVIIREVDVAVESNEQYYPFGNNQDRHRLAPLDYTKLYHNGSAWGVSSSRVANGGRVIGRASSRAGQFTLPLRPPRNTTD